MGNGRIITLSKFLSLILRHKPEALGITVDEFGWASCDEIISKSKGSRREFTMDSLVEIVRTDDKGRYSFSPDGTMIRANHGHSIPVNLELEESKPPAVLYHGTAERFLSSIMNDGLKPMSRQYVHLSIDKDVAVSVGRRHGKPVLLEINSAEMSAQGVIFRMSASGIWLTDHVEPAYLKRIDIE